MSSYDTLRLRCDANFEMKIMDDIYWVPYNSLGRTSYSNDDMQKVLLSKQKYDLRKFLNNPYEIAQYLYCSDFKDNLDIYYTERNNELWENHTCGKKSLLANKGCCASISSAFYYLLNGKFNNISTLCLFSNHGVGHAISYIAHDKYYYFYDLYTQIKPYIESVAVEIGTKSEFVKAKYITGICVRAKNIDDYIRFFLRYNLRKRRDFIFYTYSSCLCPPVSVRNENDTVTIKLPMGFNICVKYHSQNGRVKYEFAEYA